MDAVGLGKAPDENLSFMYLLHAAHVICHRYVRIYTHFP